MFIPDIIYPLEALPVHLISCSAFILENADIPDDPSEAFEQNAMKITRINAVAQVKSMVDLVDEIAANALKSMVAGEELNTKAPLGVSMKMVK